ncbi:MAG: hypothetical protein LBS92_00020 [Candidatus Methanoplasma sp.]|jgi:transposase|nr:hypothetical protein [Candidatus Methanoplasma sp.]
MPIEKLACATSATLCRRAAAAAGMAAQTGYNVQGLWNEGRVQTLRPRFGGGRKPRTSDAQKGEPPDLLSASPMETSGTG